MRASEVKGQVSEWVSRQVSKWVSGQVAERVGKRGFCFLIIYNSEIEIEGGD